MSKSEYIEDILAGTDEGAEGSQGNSRGAEVVKKFNLSDRFAVQTEQTIKELTTSFSRAFEVRDTKQKSNAYAIILPNSLPIRFKVVQQLKQFFSPNFANVVDSGFTDTAKGEFGNYCVILEKPKGRRLSEIASEIKASVGGDIKPPAKILLSEDFIVNEIVAPINELLKLFQDNNISHGRINHENVFMNSLESPEIVVGECISEPCGYSQIHQYETIERAQAMPLGKGNSLISHDYMALGVLVVYCIFGELPGKTTDVNDFINQRLHKGTYNAYLGMIELPPRLTDLLRGLLTDQEDERWGYEQVFNWIRGKKYNLIRPKLRKESVRNYDFSGVSHAGRKQLAQTYYMNWDHAAADLRDRKIGKWLELSCGDKNTADNIQSIVASTGGDKSKNRTEDDELISKALIILDPSGPIRYRNISVHIDGIGAVLANAWIHQNQAEIQTFSEIIRLNLIDFKAVHEAFEQKIDRWVLQRLQTYIKLKGLGFGLERCLYDLNSSLPCQSPIMSSQFIIDINQLLYFLNDNASRLASSDPVDRHIAAFLASRLDIAQEIKLKAMKHMRDEKARMQLVKLALLAFAQRKSGASRLSGLGNWMLSRIKSVTEGLHSKTYRKEMANELKSIADQGNLEMMLQFISNTDFFLRDQEGFAEAQRAYAVYDAELRMIRARQGMSLNQSTQYRYGLYLAKILGMVVFVITLLIVMPKHVI